jgi:hypothetical protein
MMPQVFKVGTYLVYFWSDEGYPVEPIHVHVTRNKRPSLNDTKIWITENRKCVVAHNKGRIPDRTLNALMRVIESRIDDVFDKWTEFFGDNIKYYC